MLYLRYDKQEQKHKQRTKETFFFIKFIIFSAFEDAHVHVSTDFHTV